MQPQQADGHRGPQLQPDHRPARLREAEQNPNVVVGMPANVANAVNQIYKIIEEATAEWDTLRRRRGGRGRRVVRASGSSLRCPLDEGASPRPCTWRGREGDGEGRRAGRGGEMGC